jgi:hypothetical protein
LGLRRHPINLREDREVKRHHQVGTLARRRATLSLRKSIGFACGVLSRAQ